MDGVTAAANRLVFDKKVKFILGPLAFFAPASATVIEPAKVFRFSTGPPSPPAK